MPRYTTNTTEAELQALIKKSTRGAEPMDLAKLNAAALKDLKKINFDLKNQSVRVDSLEGLLGVQEIAVPHLLHDIKPEYKNAKGKMVFFGGLAGGKDETPVFFILYTDYTGELRGYVPKQGNSWDTKSKKAKPLGKDTLSGKFDAAKLRGDIAGRIQFFGDADRSLSFIPDAKL